jgi:hypothetical protein
MTRWPRILRAVSIERAAGARLGTNHVRFALPAHKHREHLDRSRTPIHAIVPRVYGLHESLPPLVHGDAVSVGRYGQRAVGDVAEHGNRVLVAARLSAGCDVDDECGNFRARGWVLNILADGGLRTLDDDGRLDPDGAGRRGVLASCNRI